MSEITRLSSSSPVTAATTAGLSATFAPDGHRIAYSLDNVGSRTWGFWIEDLRTGDAFGVLGDNPIQSCPITEYSISGSRVLYRIACPGPNTPTAAGAFDLMPTSYHGVITMDMGGKNMTMSERHRARRLGACP